MLLMRVSSEPPVRCKQTVGAGSIHMVIERLGCRPGHRALLYNNETGDMGYFISVLSSQAEEARDRTHLTRLRSLTIRATMPRETD